MKLFFPKNKLFKLLLAVCTLGFAVTITSTITSCSCNRSSHNVVAINSNIASDYMISENTTIWTSSNSSITTHNKLLDLHKLAKDHDNADNFIINGTITFGILIDFNQNCNFEGNLNSLIQIGTSQVPMNVDTYGFVVGATIAPITDDGYNGKLYIAPSVNVHVVSNASMYGVNIQKTKFGSIQIINGNFTLTNANQDTTISDAYGINIDEANGSSIIDGTFSLYFQSVMNNVACIRITGSGVGAMQIINGNFSVDCNASGQRGLVGVLIGQNQLLPQLGNFVINGVFTINNSNSSDYAAGVQISTTQTGLFGINGVFTLSANGNVYGVNSLSTIPTPNQIIIDGYFCLLAGGQNLTYGVTTGINGLYMDDTRFYSNKTNSGYIPNEDTNQNDYYWNGSLINKSQRTTTADVTLALTNIYDTRDSNNYNFCIKAISTAVGANKQDFNNTYKVALTNYINSGSCSLIAKGWLENIIGQIDNI